MTSEKSASPLGSSSDSDFSFTTECRTPELIWNDEMALQFRQAVGEQLDLLHTRQLEDSTARLELDPAHQVEYSALDDEIYIGGIYVRLFLQNPQFDIRRPEKFIEVCSPYCSRDVQPRLTVTLPWTGAAGCAWDALSRGGNGEGPRRRSHCHADCPQGTPPQACLAPRVAHPSVGCCA